MLGIHDLPAFLVAGIALNLLPGPDTFYILGRSLTQGRTAGIVSTLGIATGALCHTLAAAFGLSALLASSTTAFLLVKYLGAAYLIYLGGQMLLARAPGAPSERMPSAALWATYRQGVLTNLANPKVALFFLAFLPQFIVPGNPYGPWPFLALGILFVCTGTCWCLLIASCAAPLSNRLRQGASGQRLLRRLTGALFVGLGLKLAGEHLP